MTNPPSPSPKNNSLLLGLRLGLTLLAVVGALALIYWAFGRPRGNAAAPTPTLVAPAPTQVVIIPTHTPAPTRVPPTATGPPTQPPTETAAALTPTASSPTLTIKLLTNVRSGPGTNYPVIAGLEVGATPFALGRDSAAKWFVISDSSIRGGQGWVANVVATYSGDIKDLPVVKAPPPPPTQSPPTAAPNPNPGSILGSRGISGQLALCNPKTTYAAGAERICFVEKIVNTTSGPIQYGVLGVQATNLSGGPSQFQTSWSGDLGIDPGCTGPTDHCGGVWEDGMRLNAPGAYRLSLQICYSPLNVCTTSDGEWETISAGINITVN